MGKGHVPKYAYEKVMGVDRRHRSDGSIPHGIVGSQSHLPGLVGGGLDSDQLGFSQLSRLVSRLAASSCIQLREAAREPESFSWACMLFRLPSSVSLAE